MPPPPSYTRVRARRMRSFNIGVLLRDDDAFLPSSRPPALPGAARRCAYADVFPRDRGARVRKRCVRVSDNAARDIISLRHSSSTAFRRMLKAKNTECHQTRRELLSVCLLPLICLYCIYSTERSPRSYIISDTLRATCTQQRCHATSCWSTMFTFDSSTTSFQHRVLPPFHGATVIRHCIFFPPHRRLSPPCFIRYDAHAAPRRRYCAFLTCAYLTLIAMAYIKSMHNMKSAYISFI